MKCVRITASSNCALSSVWVVLKLRGRAAAYSVAADLVKRVRLQHAKSWL
jgi:hypothetical protein